MYTTRVSWVKIAIGVYVWIFSESERARERESERARERESERARERDLIWQAALSLGVCTMSSFARFIVTVHNGRRREWVSNPGCRDRAPSPHPCSVCITQPPPLSCHSLPALCVSPSPHHWAITSSLLCVYHPAPTTELSLPPCSVCVTQPPPLSNHFFPALCVSMLFHPLGYLQATWFMGLIS